MPSLRCVPMVLWFRGVKLECHHALLEHSKSLVAYFDLAKFGSKNPVSKALVWKTMENRLKTYLSLTETGIEMMAISFFLKNLFLLFLFFLIQPPAPKDHPASGMRIDLFCSFRCHSFRLGKWKSFHPSHTLMCYPSFCGYNINSWVFWPA